MPIGSVILTLSFALLALGVARSRADRFWSAIAVVVIGFLIVGLGVRGGIDTGRIFGAVFLLDLLPAFGVLVLAADLIGLPVPIGRRLRLGLHSRGWEFDRGLYRLNEQARAMVKDPNQAARLATKRLPQVIAGIRALSAPDEDWRIIRDEWARSWERYLELLTKTTEGLEWAEVLAAQRDLVERTDDLRVRYRTEARRILGDR